MTYPYGTRRVDITSMARAKMTPAERVEIHNTCRARGLYLSLWFNVRERGYEAVITAGGRTYEGLAATPMEAWRKALALRDGPTIVSVLS